MEDRLQLVSRRASLWQTITQWCRSVPKRNSLVLAGDFIYIAKPSHPHVGQGVAHHKAEVHSEQADFQRLIETSGLVAMNSWGRHGQRSGTFLRPVLPPIQLDSTLYSQNFRVLLALW